jgi:diphthine-ammonia ligase
VKLAALFSGGKDSTFAIYRAQQMGHSIKCLITIHPAADDSALFHYPNSRVTKYLSKAMAIPLLDFSVVVGTSKDVEVETLALAMTQAKSLYSIEGVVNGGIASVFQKRAFEEACKRDGLVPLSPLWGVEPEKYMADLLSSGFTVMIVAISAMGLAKEWLGKVIDQESLIKLAQLSKKFGFNLTFEGGEAETLVLDCPLYSKRLSVKQATIKWDGQRGIFEILEAELLDK